MSFRGPITKESANSYLYLNSIFLCRFLFHGLKRIAAWLPSCRSVKNNTGCDSVHGYQPVINRLSNGPMHILQVGLRAMNRPMTSSSASAYRLQWIIIYRWFSLLVIFALIWTIWNRLITVYHVPCVRHSIGIFLAANGMMVAKFEQEYPVRNLRIQHIHISV